MEMVGYDGHDDSFADHTEASASASAVVVVVAVAVAVAAVSAAVVAPAPAAAVAAVAVVDAVAGAFCRDSRCIGPLHVQHS